MEQSIRRFEELLWEEDAPERDVAEELYRALEPYEGGCQFWRDIDYADPLRSDWPAAEHYYRIGGILRAFGRARLERDRAYAAKMIGALKYWLVNDFQNPNWWHNQIGMPQYIGDIAIMMRAVLDEETMAGAVELVARGSMASNKGILEKWDGANLIWGAFNTVRHALLTGDAPLLHLASERAAKEITLGLSQGIQEDYSFFQHKARLYSGGYGRSFLHEISRMLFLLQGTEFEMPADKTELVLSFVLEGLRPMTQVDALDFSCVGRELTRPNALKVGSIKRSIEILIRTPHLSRKQELKDYLSVIAGGTQQGITKYFDKALMLCHHFNGIYVGAKFLNDKLLGAETCNSEGGLCYNMSYGTQTCIMRNGGEYHNINPVWDYSRIPGTTAFLETDEQLLAREGWKWHVLPNDCSFGKQQGSRAVISELAEHDGMKIWVTDIAFEDGFVCLGVEKEPFGIGRAGLTTTVDQCFLQGEVTSQNGSVMHNGIRYTALEDTQMEQTVQTKCGSWQRNNPGRSAEPVSGEVVIISIDHSSSEVCRYAYMISAADKPEPTVEVLRNDAAVQAIRLPDGGIIAAFHEPSVLVVNGREIKGEAGPLFC